MSEATYTITESAFDELIELLEKIEIKADNLKKMCRKRSHFHVCEIRSHAYDFENMAINAREFMCDQIAEQVQYTLSDEALRMWQEAKKNNDIIYISKETTADGTFTIIDTTEWEKMNKEPEED